MTQAAVFFDDRGDHWACALLRPGYRHVEVAVEAGGKWVGISGKLGGLIEALALPDGFEPRAFAQAIGCRVLLVPYEPVPRTWLFQLQTCVGVAKAVLGLRAPFVWTPWQLYRELSR